MLDGCDFAKVRKGLAAQASSGVGIRLRRKRPRLVYGVCWPDVTTMGGVPAVRFRAQWQGIGRGSGFGAAYGCAGSGLGRGSRTITAIVERKGDLRAAVKPATYKANVRVSGPRRVRVIRAKASTTVARVAPSKGRLNYRVDLTLADGRRFTATTKKKKFILRALPKSVRGSVTVRALYPDGKASPAARAKLA